MNYANESFGNLSNDLSIIRKWVHVVIFSRKKSIQSHLVLTFDNSPVMKNTHHKPLGLILDEKINFYGHSKEEMSKGYNDIAILRKLQIIISRKTLY